MKQDPPAYHLRTNKNVERLLFIDLLRRVSPHLPIDINRYHYVGMGGPYLEDFSLIQSAFGCRKMISLETEKHVISRQELNRPNCRVDLLHKSTGDFSSEYETARTPLIVWFDYTKHNWVDQINECTGLISKLPSGSIFKVTLKCTAKNLLDGVSQDDATRRNPVAARLKSLESMFGRYGPFSLDDVRDENFYKTLYVIFKKALGASLGDTKRKAFKSLGSFAYNDGTPMLTISIIVGDIVKIDRAVTESRLNQWPFADINWSGPQLVSIPNLSLRERLLIDSHLPDTSAQKIRSKLKLSLADNRSETITIIKRYISFSIHVPHFIKTTI